MNKKAIDSFLSMSRSTIVNGICMKKLVSLLAGLAAMQAQGDLIMYNFSNDANNHYIDIAFTSPFTAGGPNVDSAMLYFNPLFESLYQFSWNQNAFGSVEDMVSDGVSAQILPDIANPRTDEFAVNMGWNSTLSTNGVSLGNVGGIPTLDYETWNPQGQTSGTSGDTLYARLTLSNDLLDGNGSGWSQADVDAGIDAYLTLQDFTSIIGYANTENQLSPRYVEGNAPIGSIIPEPSAVAQVLTGAALLAALGRRRRDSYQSPKDE